MLQGLRKTDPYAGILGDIITSVNGKKVTNSNDLFIILDPCKEGEKVWLCFHFFDVLTRRVCVLGGGMVRGTETEMVISKWETFSNDNV